MESLLTAILLVVFIGEIVFILIKIPATRITLGNLGDFYARVPENTGLAIMKNRKLKKIILAVSEQKKDAIERYVKEADYKRGIIKEIREEEDGEEEEQYTEEEEDASGVKPSKNKSIYDFIDNTKADGLRFIGPSFLGYDVYEWFETQEDESDGVRALHSIDLAEQVIKYLPAEPKKMLKGEEGKKEAVSVEGAREGVEYDSHYGVPSFKSADNIEIRTSLTFYFIVLHPRKVLFDIRYRKRAVKEQIFPLWRDVLGQHSFFTYQIEKAGGVDEKKLKKQSEKGKTPAIVPDIRTKSNDALRKALGIELGSKEKKGKKKGEETIQLTSKLIKGGLADRLFKDQWGIRVTDVTVGELEAVDPAIEEALGAQMKARTKALAAIETAIGKELADMHEGSGRKKYFSQYLEGILGEGEGKIGREQAIQALVKLKNFEALKDIPPDGRVFYQWPGDNLGASPQEALKKALDFLGIDLNTLGGKK